MTDIFHIHELWHVHVQMSLKRPSTAHSRGRGPGEAERLCGCAFGLAREDGSRRRAVDDGERFSGWKKGG